MNPAIQRIKNRKMLRAHRALGLSALLVASSATVGSLHAQTNWNSAAVTTADRYTVGTSTSLLWSDTASWFDGTVANGAGLSVSLEPRHLTGNMTVTVDGTYTVGTLTSRTSNADLRFTGSGMLIFDNGTSGGSYWNATSRVTRLTNLRTDLFVNFQMNNALDIRMGVSRAEETTVGRIGNIISGDGKLTLSLAQNDPATNRLIKIGNGASANTYAGGTEIRHVVNTTYGTGHAVGVNSLLVNAVNTGAFGTGDVTLNSQGLNTTAVTTLTSGSGGLQLVLSANNSMGATAVLTQSGNGAGTVFLGSTSQTIGGLDSTTTNKRIQTNTGALIINLAADLSYAGRLVGTGSLTIGGTHTQTFTGQNSRSGVTTLTGGALSVEVIGDGGTTTGNLSGAAADAANLVFNGGTLKYTGAAASTDRNFTINAGKTAGFDVTEELTLGGGAAASTGGLAKLGIGKLILAGSNLYTGTTDVREGILQLVGTVSSSSALNLGSATGNSSGKFILGSLAGAVNQTFSGLTTTGAGVANAIVGGNSAMSTLTFDLSSDYSFNGVIGGAGTNENNLALVKSGAGTLTLNGANTYTGDTSITAGVLKLGANGSLASRVSVSGTGKLDVSDVEGGYAMANNESFNIGAGSSSAGNFNVGNNSQLKINGDLTGDVEVGAGGTLSGSGTIEGAVSIADGGVLAPGNSPGILTVTDLNLASGSVFEFDLVLGLSQGDQLAQTLRGTAYDGVNVTGDFTGTGAIFRIVLGEGESFADSFWNSSRTWSGIFADGSGNPLDIASIFTGGFEYYTTLEGVAVVTTGPSAIVGNFSFSGSDLLYTISGGGDPIPEPSSALFGLLIGAGLLRRRRVA